MKMKNKILAVNILTVVCAILTLLSFSAISGFSLSTAIAIFLGMGFANVTWLFVKLENVLRKKANNRRAVARAVSNTVEYPRHKAGKVA